MVYENRSKNLLKMLTNLKERNTVLTNNFFTNDQWIQYNPKGYYEYEDGAFLGNTPEDVVEFFEDLEKSEFGNWLQTAKWIEI